MGLMKRPSNSGQSHVTSSQLVSCVVYLVIIGGSTSARVTFRCTNQVNEADWEEETSSSRYSLSPVPKSATLTQRDTVTGNIKVTTDSHMEASSSEVVTSSTVTYGGTDESARTYSHPNNDVTTDSPTTEALSSEGIVTSIISFEGSSASTATRKQDGNDVTTAPPMESSSSDGMMTSTVSVHEHTSDVTEKGTALSVCDGGWMSSESSSYMYISEKLSQTEAGARCAANGGHLVYVETLEENKTIKDLVAMCEEFWNRRAYMGLTDETIEDTWMWGTNKTANYFNWIYSFGVQQPNGGTLQNCAIINGNTGKWHDRSCDDEYAAVCEK